MLIRQPSSNILGRRSNTLILDFFIPVEQGVQGAVHHPFTFVVRHRFTRLNLAAASGRCWTQKSTSGRRTSAPVQNLGQFPPAPFVPPISQLQVWRCSQDTFADATKVSPHLQPPVLEIRQERGRSFRFDTQTRSSLRSS